MAGDATHTEGVDLIAERLHHADHVGGFGAADDHRDLPVELAVGDGGVGLVLGFHHATCEGRQDEREPNEGSVFPVGRRVGVVDVGVKLRRKRLDELGFGLDFGIFLGQFVVAHPGVFQQQHLASVECVDRVEGVIAVDVVNKLDFAVDVGAENVGVLIQRDEGVVAGPALMGHEHDAVARLGEFFDRCRVPFEPAVVLYLAVLDRGVQIEADEDALCVVEIVDGVESCHWYVGNRVGR